MSWTFVGLMVGVVVGIYLAFFHPSIAHTIWYDVEKIYHLAKGYL